jgi:uncharacterized membrane-anchored protein
VAVRGLTLDAGAFLAAEKDSRPIWVILKAARKHGARLTTPAPVVAQVWRATPHPDIARLLKACEVDDLVESSAKEIGKLIGECRTHDVVDGAVVVGAVARGDAILTSDPDDIQRLVDATGKKLPVTAI